MKLREIKKDLKAVSDPQKARQLQIFFKTGKREYGEGDIFLGIKVPEQRKIVKKYQNLELKDIQKLLNSKIHEYRLTSLLILVKKFQKSDAANKKKFYQFYLKNTKNINNWDLVDLTAPKIIGNYLLDKKRDVLYQLARSKNLWEKRIAILATFEFICNGEQRDSLKIARLLLYDKHDLIHKGVGWMLREVGKRVSQQKEEEFLKKYYQKMPRTMLRYAIEKFDKKKKAFYMGN